MKKALFLALALSLILAGTAMATVVGGPHDLSSYGSMADKATNTGKTCVFCHAVHNAYVNPGGSTTNTYPLWNHQLSTVASYGIYLSDTMNVTPTAWGGATTSKSALCMSCHDGTVGVNVLYVYPYSGTPAMGSGNELDSSARITSTALLGSDLSNDHPVNFTYNAALATADGGLNSPSNGSYVDAGLSIPLYNSTVQCASCHKVHDNTIPPFLRVTQNAGALCLICHIK